MPHGIHQMSYGAMFSVFGVVPLLIAVCGLVMWRRERLVFCTALVAAVLPMAWFFLGAIDDALPLVVMFLNGCAVGVIAYTIMRAPPLQSAPAVAAIAGGICAVLAPLIAYCGGIWPAMVIPVGIGLALACAVVAGVACAVIAAGQERPTEGPSAPSDEDRRTTLRLLAEGKITAEEAQELLKALGGATPGDRLPMTGGLRASILGGLLIVVGFMLPWSHVKIAGLEGYQAGYNVGFLGWLILTLGVLPAVLACIPALETHVRQALLRLLLAGMGVAFAMPMFVRGFAGSSAPGSGLFIVLAGFGLQLLTGLARSGILRPAGPA